MSNRAERIEGAALEAREFLRGLVRLKKCEDTRAGEVLTILSAALAEPPDEQGEGEVWPTYNHVYALAEDGKDERFVVVGGRVCLSREDYEIARRAVNRSAAVDEVIAAARRVVAHWQIVAAPVDAFGVDTMGKLTGELDAALAKVKGE